MRDGARTGYRRGERRWLRGADRQRAFRLRERDARRHALATARWAGWCGWTVARAARALGIDADTLREWRRRADDPTDRLLAAPLGAPPILATPAQRDDVRAFLALHGAHLGLDVLRDHFPHLARRDLGVLRQIARLEADRVVRGGTYHALAWSGPGRVWAMDHTEPPQPIDGRYRWALTVRDLASGCTLAALAVEQADAASTIDCLRALITRHGAPLVLKADNGPAFIAAETRDFLRRHRVRLLRSPAYTPAYNGACEAGNGTIKTLTHEIACRHDRPQSWTLDDLEATRLLANDRRTDRIEPRTPGERFADRTPVAAAERDAFDVAYRAARTRRAAQLDVDREQTRRTITNDALDRQAITDALIGTGVLTIRSRRLRLSNPLQEVG